MRTLTPAQEAEREKSGRRRYVFATVYWESGTSYYTTRDFSPDFGGGKTGEPILERAPECSRGLNASLDGTALAGQTTLSLVNDPTDGNGIGAKLATEISVEGVRVDVCWVFGPAAGRDTVVEADWITQNTYAIDAVESITAQRVTLALVDWVEAKGGKSFGRRITRELMGVDVPDGSWGLVIPLLYGRKLRMVPAIAVSMGRSTTLDRTIESDTGVLYAGGSLADWADSGVFRLDEERVRYVTIDRVNNSFGTADSPCERGYEGTDAVEHGDGSPVREVLDEYRFILCEGECKDMPLTATGDLVDTSATISNVSIDTGVLAVGTPIEGTGIAAGTVIESVNAVDELTMSAAATATGPGEGLTFGVLAFIGDKRVFPRVLVEGLGGSDVTHLILDDLPIVEELATFATELKLDGKEEGAWSDPGGSTCDSVVEDVITANSSDAGFDGSEKAHVSFCLMDAQAEKNEFRGAYGTDHRLRRGTPKGFRLEIDYRVLPGYRSETAPPEGFDWSAPLLQVTRGGSEFASADLAKPSALQLTGFLPTTTFTPALVDSRPLFGQESEGSRGFQYVSGAELEFVWKVGHHGDESQAARVKYWLELQGASGGEAVMANLSSIALTYSPTSDYLWPTRFSFTESRKLRLKPLGLPEEAQTYTKIEIFVTATKDTVSGRLSVEAWMAGLEANNSGPYDFAADQTRTISLTFEGVFAPEDAANLELKIWPNAHLFDIPDEPHEKVNEVDFTIHSVSLNYTMTSTSSLAGATKRLLGAPTTLDDLRVLAGSPLLTQRLDLTTAIRSGAEFAADRWSFFDGTLEARLTTGVEMGATALAVVDIRFVVEYLESGRRTLGEGEIDLRVAEMDGLEGLPIRVGSGLDVMWRPEDVIYNLLVNVWGLDPGFVDTVSLLAATVDRQSWEFARRLDQEIDHKTLLAQACHDAAVHLIWDGGGFRFVGDLFPQGFGAEEVLDESVIRGPVERHWSDEAERVTRYGIYHRRKWYGDQAFLGYEEMADEEAESGAAGVLRDTVDLEWVRDGATAVAWGAKALRVSARRREVLRGLTVGLGLGRLHVGDTVVVNHARYGLDEIVGRVAGLADRAGAFAISVLTGGIREHLWEYDEDTYIDVFPLRRMFEFVIGGVKVATLDGNGVWTFDSFHRLAFDGSTTQTEMFEWNAGTSSIDIAVLHGGTRKVMARIVDDGTLRCGTPRGNRPPVAPDVGSVTDYVDDYTQASGARFDVGFSADLEILAGAVFWEPGSGKGGVYGKKLKF